MTDPQLAAAITAHKRAERALEVKRVELLKAIAEAVTSGRVRQVDAAKELGQTREQIRRICFSVAEWEAGRNPDLKILRKAEPAPE